MSGSQSRSPASAKDSKLTCSGFTSTLHSYPAPSGHHCTSWHLMYALIVHTSSTLQLFMVLNCVTSAVAASIAVHGEWVSLAIVVLALGLNILTVPTAIYCCTSYDKCTYCKSLWIKASATCPKCKRKCYLFQTYDLWYGCL